MNFSKIIDVSMPIHEKMPVYAGDPKPSMEWAKSLPDDSSFVTKLSFGAHTGTHVDAPMHFKIDGLRLDQVPLDSFVGTALIVDATHETEKVTLKTVQGQKVKKGDIVLFKTRNSSENFFRNDFVYLDTDAANFLVGFGVKTIGVDGLSVDRYKSGNHPTHHALLDNGVAIIEGLCLKEAPVGRHFFVCLPLKLQGTEAAPARAVLLV